VRHLAIVLDAQGHGLPRLGLNLLGVEVKVVRLYGQDAALLFAAATAGPGPK
jgi:hypothetical protein